MSIVPEAGFPVEQVTTLVELLCRRAEFDGDQIGYRFIADDSVEHTLTYAQLHARALQIAAQLQQSAAIGERILLLYPPGLEFVEAFFGCLYAGAVAVPAYPPRANRSQLRLQSIVQDVASKRVLCLSSLVSKLGTFPVDFQQLKTLDWIATDSIEQENNSHWTPPDISGAATAFLQYTSGSTSAPKGVMLTHSNLLCNAGLIHNLLQHTRKDRYVSWLPMFHDMGFMAGVLQPLYAGIETVLMSPAGFLQRPLRWLQAISRYKGTTSGGPNFSFDLCVRKIKEEEKCELNLQAWDVTFNGAEPVRAETIEAFSKAFGKCGFRREAFFPCYGLAEATLMVSGGRKASAPLLKTFSAKAIGRGSVEEECDADDQYTLVGCGKSLPGQEVVIVDPATRQPCSPEEIGEIWVKGPSVGTGYWAKPAETQATFGATLKSGDGGAFLRTGDLGFVLGGELFVAGRLKDLIVIRGLNHYPQDLENTVESVSSLLRPGCGAAFAITVAGEEKVVVVQEADRSIGPEMETVIAQIRDAVSEMHGIAVHAIILLKKGTVPKTSSGKIQRQACRKAFLNDDLSTIGIWRESAAPIAETVPSMVNSVGQTTAEEIEAWLLSQLAGRKGINHSQLASDRPIIALGVDSLQATELVHAIEERFQTTIPLTDILEDITIRQLVAQILGTVRYPISNEIALVSKDGQTGSENFPLSHGQRALWFQQKLFPDNAVYNIFGAVRLLTRLDEAALKNAVAEVMRRHASLRTLFTETSAGPAQRIHPNLPPDFRTIDVAGCGHAYIADLLQEEAHKRFDLENGPLVRIRILDGGGEGQVMLLVLHHIIADFWSLELLIREIFGLYQRNLRNENHDLPSSHFQFADFVQWQKRLLTCAEAEADSVYWHRELQSVPLLNLPIDQAWPTEPSCHAATVHFVANGEALNRIHVFAQECGVTAFAVLLAAFQVLLHRYTNQEDIVVGIPVSGRDRAEFAQVIGYFVNPLAIRTNSFGPQSCRNFVKHVAGRVLAAFEHGAYPFSLIVEKVHPDRNVNRPPIFQTMFVHQKGTSSTDGALAAVASGLPGIRVELEGIHFETIQIDSNATDLDLVLTVSETAAGLAGTLKYRREIFEPATMERMATSYMTLLEAMIGNVDAEISELSTLSNAERTELLVLKNKTEASYPGDFVHKLFERQVDTRAEAIAVEYEDQRLSYKELNARANQVAHRLQDLGVGPEVRVAICIERSLELMIGLLGILKAGGAYVPLDPSYPRERLDYMLNDAQALVLLTQEKLVRLIQNAQPQVVFLDPWNPELNREPISNPETDIGPDNLAYLIYTSGSTGKPKGVLLQHGGLSSLLHDFGKRLEAHAQDTLLAATSLSFDIATLELLLPLVNGGRVVIATTEQARDARLLGERLSSSKATIMQATPGMWRALVKSGWSGERSHLRVISGGEALLVELACQLRERSRRLINGYGPTETTIYSVSEEVESAIETVAIGGPVANTQVYVMGKNLQPVPLGVAGELAIGGDGVARGYLNRPELTAEKFVANPFSSRGGDRIYKTGDLVRWTPQGRLEYLGRMDQQVKIRGFRIELGEIESVMEQHVAVKQAVVAAFEYQPQDKRLVAYIVAAEGSGDLSAELRALARTKLPDYMIPWKYVRLDRLPQTANGKVDRRRLPAVNIEDGEREQARVDAMTALEEMLAGIWRAVLGVEHIGLNGNFFELGGHSLLATQVVVRVREAWNLELQLRTLFECQTLKALAQHIQSEQRAQRGAVLPVLRPASRAQELPLSYGQQRLWFLDQLENGAKAYHITAAVRLLGPLSVERLAESFREVMRRHEVLRTSFPSEQGKPRQQVHPSLEFPLERLDLRGLRDEEAEQRMRELLREREEADFELANGPLLRAVLVRLEEEHHVFQVTLHHIISDGWSMGVLVDELTQLYKQSGESGPLLPKMNLQFSDYAVWQREWVESGALEGQRAYWRQQLAGLEPLQLPSNHSRGRVARSEGRTEQLTTPPQLLQQLRRFSAKHNATLFMTLLSAFQILLWRYTGQSDVAVGTVAAGRTVEGVEKLIGFFVNTLVIRTQLEAEDSFHDLLYQVRQTLLEAFANQDVPFEKVVDDLHPERSLTQTPLFQVMFVMQNAPLPEMDLGSGIRVSRMAREEQRAQFDLVVEATETERGLLLSAKYRAQLFEPAAIGRMLGHYQRLLEAAIANPEDAIGSLPLIHDGERRMLQDWNRTECVYESKGMISELFEREVENRAEAIAVEYEEQRLSYKELNARANQLAHRLHALGVGPEVRVAICIERSLELIIGLLGVLKAGGAYVPLDPSHPRERLDYMLNDAHALVLLTQEKFLPQLPAFSRVIYLDRDWTQIATQSRENLDVSLHDLGSIYVIYTSGSTGKPKGVINTHAGVRNRLLWMQEEYRLGVNDCVLQKTTSTFDVSVWEFFWPLIAGSTLVLARPEGHRDSRYLAEVITEKRITTIHFVPSMLNAFIQDGGLDHCASLRNVICSGEALSRELQDRFFALANAELHNLYGPTEAAVDVSFWRCERRGSRATVPIGGPIANIRLYVLDEWMESVPVGVAGELYIAGIGLARGYLNRPALTAERFVAHPFGQSGDRLYQTGDLARWQADGTIEYLGRKDYQVKIRGLRIELGEIEAVLEQHEAVQQAAVRVREDRIGDRRLVAYVVCRPGVAADTGELKGHLKEQLPDYMVPASFLYLDSFPLNASGKLDNNALPSPELRDSAIEKRYVAPRTAAEEILAELWAGVLGLSRVGVNDNFFELGGDSILSIEIVARANKAGLPLTPRHMFEFQTIAELAQVSPEKENTPAQQERVTGEVPLTPIQSWYLEQSSDNLSYFNQAILLEPRNALDPNQLQAAVRLLIDRHDALRMRFYQQGARWKQENLAEEVNEVFQHVDRTGIDIECGADEIRRETEKWQASLDLQQGPLFRAVLIRLKNAQRLFLVCHHLVIDAVSWQILLQDLESSYMDLGLGRQPNLGAKTTSFKQWAEALHAYATSQELATQRTHWDRIEQGAYDSLPIHGNPEENLEKWSEIFSRSLSEEETSAILHQIPSIRRISTQEILLAALGRGIAEAMGIQSVLVEIEGHGRDSLQTGLNVTRTVGWFTSLYPFHLRTGQRGDWDTILRRIRNDLMAVPARGTGYGVLRYLAGCSTRRPKADIVFNYLGQLDHGLHHSRMWKGIASKSGHAVRSPGFWRPHLIEVNGGIVGGMLNLNWTFGARLLKRSDVENCADRVQAALSSLIQNCLVPATDNFSPDDFTEISLSQEDLDLIMAKEGGVIS